MGDKIVADTELVKTLTVLVDAGVLTAETKLDYAYTTGDDGNEEQRYQKRLALAAQKIKDGARFVLVRLPLSLGGGFGAVVAHESDIGPE